MRTSSESSIFPQKIYVTESYLIGPSMTIVGMYQAWFWFETGLMCYYHPLIASLKTSNGANKLLILHDFFM